MDTFLPIFGLLMIMALIVGATIKINILMKGKIINFLLNRKLLLLVASIISVLFIFAFVMSISYMDWSDFFWLTYSIAVIFIIANYSPILVLYLSEIHQNNLVDINEYQLEDQIEQTDVQEDIKASSKEIIKNIIKLALVVAIAWFIMSGLGIVEHGDGVYPYFLSLIPIVLIVSYVLVKLPSSFKGVFQTKEESIK